MEKSVRNQMAQPTPVTLQQSNDLGACMIALYDKGLWTDIKFRCKDHDEKEGIHAHKIVLAARSPVFQAMFFGPCADSKNEVQLDNIESNILDLFLRYVYSDTVDLTKETATAVFEIAHYYQVKSLESFCAGYLATVLTAENACEILSLALLYKVTPLRDVCCDFIDKNAEDVLNSEGFLELSEESFNYIIKGDTFYSSEVNIFHKVEEWMTKKLKNDNLDRNGTNLRLALGPSFYYLRFPAMKIKDLMDCTRKKGYFSVGEYEDIIDCVNKVPGSSVKRNSCVERIETEETLLVNKVRPISTVDSISNLFKISVSRDVKLTNIVLEDNLKYDET